MNATAGPATATLWGRVFDRLWTLGWRPQVLLLLTVLAAGALLPRLTLDMSFRPLFVADGELVSRTEAFEAEFGQISGAWIAAILEGPDWRDPDRRSAVESLASVVTGLDHVQDVASLGDAPASGEHEATARASTVLSADGRLTAVLARLDLPLDDLAARRPVIAAFRATVEEQLPVDTVAHYTGVSVVEDVYSDEVLTYLGLGVGLTVIAVAAMLLLLWGSPARVLVAMAGTSLATPLTLAAMAAAGKAITLVSSMVPTMILVIGVADAIHMIGAFDDRRRRGATPRAAARRVWQELARPCLLTTLTTAGGFIALAVAGLPAIREFGLVAALGVGLAWIGNQLTVPFLLGRWAAADTGPRSAAAGLLDRGSRTAARVALRRPVLVIAGAAIVVVVALSGISQLRFDQRFNDELGSDHPVAEGQRLFERHFGGLLGPEMHIHRQDGDALSSLDLERIARFARALRGDTRVLDVAGPAEHRVPGSSTPPYGQRVSARQDPLVAADGRSAAVVVRVGDLGTDAARQFVEALGGTARTALGPGLRADVLGQWWLAQLGMAGLIDDMIAGFLWAFFIVTPLVWLGLRRGRLALASVLPNLLPLAVALGFMGWADISVRIGTAMVLAIALGIAVDDSLHVLARYRREHNRRRTVPQALCRTTSRVGPALIATTLVLTAGFMSMTTSGLIAIRDMGVVATATVVAALFADLLLLPALLLVSERSMTIREPAPGKRSARSISRRPTHCS